jgi:hypothetical protein
MRKAILAITLMAITALAAPRDAAAQVSLHIGQPGFSLHAGPPLYGPPVVVAPPALAYGPPVYYPYRPHYYRGHGHWKHWDKHWKKHHHKHHGHWDD